jgi:hypothetical protein
MILSHINPAFCFSFNYARFEIFHVKTFESEINDNICQILQIQIFKNSLNFE